MNRNCDYLHLRILKSIINYLETLEFNLIGKQNIFIVIVFC